MNGLGRQLGDVAALCDVVTWSNSHRVPAAIIRPSPPAPDSHSMAVFDGGGGGGDGRERVVNGLSSQVPFIRVFIG